VRLDHFLLGLFRPDDAGLDQREWSVFECSGCSHHYMNPQPSWEELQFYYNNSYDPYDPMHGSQNEDDRMIELAKRTGVFRHIPVPMGSGYWDVAPDGSCAFRRSWGQSSKAWSRANTPPDSRKQGLRIFHWTLESYV
jgi:hypothetical protein